MAARRGHFPRTTPSQRRLLFETWEATGDIARACHTAHMGRRTFYYWKPRFAAGGCAALASFRKPVARAVRRTPAAVAERVIQARRQHPDWGKRRLADELAKGNNWVPLVSPNTVKRILREAGLWAPPAAPAQKGGRATPAAPPSSPARP
jgi:trehalose utilization protein